MAAPTTTPSRGCGSADGVHATTNINGMNGIQSRPTSPRAVPEEIAHEKAETRAHREPPRDVLPALIWQPVVKVWLHSTGDASSLAALLLAQIFPIFSVVAPCQRGASPVSVRRQTSTTGC